MKTEKTGLDFAVEKTFETCVMAVIFVALMTIMAFSLNEFLDVIGVPYHTVFSVIIMLPVTYVVEKIFLFLLK